MPRAVPSPPPHAGKRGERYAHTHTGDPHPPLHATYTGNERLARTSKSSQARHDRHRHGQAIWYEGTRRVKKVRTNINTRAGMLHAALRHATKSATTIAQRRTKVCDQPRGIVVITCPPLHAHLHREHKGPQGVPPPQQAKQDKIWVRRDKCKYVTCHAAVHKRDRQRTKVTNEVCRARHTPTRPDCTMPSPERPHPHQSPVSQDPAGEKEED